MVSGTVVRSYLDKGPSVLLDYLTANAANVMIQKRSQAIAPELEA